jgi:hypothetical protein
MPMSILHTNIHTRSIHASNQRIVRGRLLMHLEWVNALIQPFPRRRSRPRLRIPDRDIELGRYQWPQVQDSLISKAIHWTCKRRRNGCFSVNARTHSSEICPSLMSISCNAGHSSGRRGSSVSAVTYSSASTGRSQSGWRSLIRMARSEGKSGMVLERERSVNDKR